MKVGKFILMAALVGLIMALVAMPAAADAPVVDKGTNEGDDITDLCPGLEIHDHYIVTGESKAWYDAAGGLLKGIAEWKGEDNFYNAARPEVVLSGHYAGTYHIQELGNINMSVGIAYHITIPGYGDVLLVAGMDLFTGPDVVHKGHNSLSNPADLAVFCAYLAGD